MLNNAAWPPARLDWNWLGNLDTAQLQRLGRHPASPPWLHAAYADLARRHQDWPAAITDTTEALPASQNPVLFARSDGKGVMGFYTCELLTLREPPAPQISDPALHAARCGSQAVCHWFTKETQVPCQSVLEGPIGAAGTSAAGAGLLAALRALVGPDTAPASDCCTAGWDHGHLTPVDANTLQAKIAAAKRWGYQRLWLCEGQTGIPNSADVADNTDIIIATLPPEPAAAINTLLTAWNCDVKTILAQRPPRAQVFLAWQDEEPTIGPDGKLIRPSSDQLQQPIWAADDPQPLLEALTNSSRGAVLHAGPGTAAGPSTEASAVLITLAQTINDGEVVATQSFLDVIPEGARQQAIDLGRWLVGDDQIHRLWSFKGVPIQLTPGPNVQFIDSPEFIGWKPRKLQAIGKYVLLAEVAANQHTALWRTDCGHVIRLALTDVGRQNINAEAHLPAGLNAGIIDTQLQTLPNYIVYDQTYQQTLRTWWPRHGDPAWAEALSETIVAQLAAWHENEKTHGDLQSDAILISQQGRPLLTQSAATGKTTNDLAQSMQLCEQLWRARRGDWPDTAEPGFQHQVERQVALNTHPKTVAVWLQTIRQLPQDRDHLALRKRSQRRRRQQMLFAIAAIIIGLGFLAAFQAGQAQRQADRAKHWGERLALSTVHDVATAGQTATALELAQHMQQELAADGEQQATLTAVIRSIAELAEGRLDWATAIRAWQLIGMEAPEWQHEAQAGIFRCRWALEPNKRDSLLAEAKAAGTLQADDLATYTNLLSWEKGTPAADFHWPEQPNAMAVYLELLLVDGRLTLLDASLRKATDIAPEHLQLLQAGLAIERGNYEQARKIIDQTLPLLESIALQDSGHPGNRWDWQYARYLRMRCGGYVASADRQANAEQLTELAHRDGAPVHWRLHAWQAHLIAAQENPQAGRAAELLAAMDTGRLLTQLPPRQSTRLRKQYHTTLSKLYSAAHNESKARHHRQAAAKL